MDTKLLTALVSIVLALSPLHAQAQEPADVSTPYARIWRVKGDADTLKLYVKDAIINRGLKVTEGDIGQMLDRTAEDIGGVEDNFAAAYYLQFCSALASQQATKLDLANIAFCPFTIFVYAPKDDPGVVHVGYRRFPEGRDPAMRDLFAKFDALLSDIVQEALE